MTTEMSFFQTDYTKLNEKSLIDERHLFDVRTYEIEKVKNSEDDENFPLMGINKCSNEEIVQHNVINMESFLVDKDTIQDFDVEENERRQREANEETTRSEDLRLFLQEMHRKCQPLDPMTMNNIVNKSPESEQRSFVNNQYDQEMMDPCQDIEMHATTAETAQIGPPDGGWAWLVVLASFFCMFTIDGTCFNYGLLVPDMMNSFPQSNLMPYIWPGSLIAGSYMSIGPIASALSNQFNFRSVAMAGAIFSGLALFVSSFMNNLLAFILLFGVFGGIGFGLIYLPAIAIVGHWFHEKRSIAVGLALCGSGCGTMLYGQLIPFLIDMFTWRGTVILLAAVCAQSLVLIALFRPLDVHLRLQQIFKIRSTIRQINREEQERIRLENEHKLEEEKRRKRSEKEKLREQNRMKNKRIVIYRGSIMQKIIEEKRRQRTVSMGSLDGMVITKDNELIKVAKSSFDLYEKPILSVNTINRITEAVVKRLENKVKKHGPNGVVTFHNVWDSKSGCIGTNTYVSNNQIKNSLPQLVQEYINSQLSVHVTPINGNTSQSIDTQQQNNFQSSSYQIDSSSKTSLNQSLVLQDDAKAVIQASLCKEISRPYYQKELFFTGSMHQLCENQKDSENPNHSETSLNLTNACNTSINESGNQSMVENMEHSQACMGGDLYSDQYVDGEPHIDNMPVYHNEGPFVSFLRELLNTDLLYSPTFILMVISSISAMLGIFVPFFFLPVYMTSLDIDISIAGQLISYVGIANTSGRLFATLYIEKAWSSNYPWADCLWMNNLALILAGLTAFSMPFLIEHHNALIFVLCLFGFCVAGFVSLKSILVVELLGLDRLTNAFGFLLIFQGVATICGPPAAAILCDLCHGRYDVAFYFSGCVLIVACILCVPLRTVAGIERRYHEKHYNQLIIDEENSVGAGSYVEMHNDEYNKDQSDQDYGDDNRLLSDHSDDIEDKLIPANQKIEVFEIIEEPTLEPVVEEEEEEEENR